jgi:hypothetical protein
MAAEPVKGYSCHNQMRVGRSFRLGAATIGIGTVAWLSVGLGQAGVASAAVGALRSAGCKPLASDPQIEAPTYAQEEGASGSPDGWWCQLPHATKLPATFITFRRDISPLPNTYAIYSTQYGPPKSTTYTITRGPTISVSMDVNSSVSPGRHHNQPASTTDVKKVRLGHGITATVRSHNRLVVVAWNWPTSGVPKYLSAVASVTVTGHDLPESTVIAVARAVRPA